MVRKMNQPNPTSYKSQILTIPESKALLLSDQSITFPMLSHWKIAEHQAAKLDEYYLTRLPLSALKRRLHSGQGRLNGHIPIYRGTSYIQLIQREDNPAMWLSFRTLGPLKVVLIMEDQTPTQS